MNRYELHEKLKEAEKKGYERGRDETLLQHSAVSRFANANAASAAWMGAQTADPSLTGKYRCRVEWSQMPTHAAYELRATLVVGRKFYNAKQTVPYDTWTQLRSERESFKGYLNRWLDGAYTAMWREFKKDVLFEFPNLDEQDSRTPEPRRPLFAGLGGFASAPPRFIPPPERLATPEPERFDIDDTDW